MRQRDSRGRFAPAVLTYPHTPETLVTDDCMGCGCPCRIAAGYCKACAEEIAALREARARRVDSYFFSDRFGKDILRYVVLPLAILGIAAQLAIHFGWMTR